jgi:hypothetical protein
MGVRGGWCISVSVFVLCVVVIKDLCSENKSYQCITDYEHVQRFIDDLHVTASSEATNANV